MSENPIESANENVIKSESPIESAMRILLQVLLFESY
jgi:hypothetical protein